MCLFGSFHHDFFAICEFNEPYVDFFLYFSYLGFRANRIYLYTMQSVQSDGHCPVLQHGHNDRILVHGHFTCTVSVPCGLCVQQNSMDEN